MTGTGDVAAANLVGFVRSLRSAGFGVSPETTRRLVDAARLVGMHRSEDVREAFRAVVVTRQSQSAHFDELFDQFFSGDVVMTLDDGIERVARRTRPHRAPRIGATSGTEADGAEDRDDALDVVGGSDAERFMDVDFAELSDEEAASVAALLAAMTWKPASVRSRRWRPASSGSVLDLRRTMRRMTGPNGDLMPLAFLERRPRQRPLIVLADISGSMDRYSEMLLHFVHGAQYRFGTVESFVFATRLTRITRQLRRRNSTDALARVARTVRDWSGGTRIGEAIGAFNRNWSRRVGGGGPITLIISDGWDTGDPRLLAREMGRLARSVHKVIWLNPLVGHVGYTPQARGMAAAMPFVDDLLAGGTARNLVDLIELLQSASVGRRSAASL
ncbi:MAG TPA: VWA domain-containing protein [Actinobacteria bacterium]|nr:VWA domain containing CoxE-like protein [bacterium BMS3Bbin01]HDH26173.1 VWA domain-containing protein [Actinomycetota bacterium]